MGDKGKDVGGSKRGKFKCGVGNGEVGRFREGDPVKGRGSSAMDGFEERGPLTKVAMGD